MKQRQNEEKLAQSTAPLRAAGHGLTQDTPLPVSVHVPVRNVMSIKWI